MQNPQDILAGSLEGIFLVDAGAGTGKTHTIIRRYNKLIESGQRPENILLITFTNVAAAQMKEDVISKVNSEDVTVTELLEAPVMTFHALCTRILKKGGSNAPTYIGIPESLSPNFGVLENGTFEIELFRRYFTLFRLKNSRRYENILLSLDNDYLSLLGIIKKLCSAGIFPAKNGWLEDGLSRLKGDETEFTEIVRKNNEQKKNEQTRAREIINKECGNVPVGLNTSEYITDKLLNVEKISDIFNDPTQSSLIEFIREIYTGYVTYLIKRNQLSFEFLVMLAYVKLLKDDAFRENSQFDHVMVDEFQDTDKIQFKLLLLLCRNIGGRANLMAVGDWRQGIYGFRNTTIENITEFSRNIEVHKEAVNNEKQRIGYGTAKDDITRIAFEYNYRSSQEILDFSRNALFVKAKGDEESEFKYEAENFERSLTARRKPGKYTEIGFLQSAKPEEEDETRLILDKIKELVSDDRYRIVEHDMDGRIVSERRVRFSDIAVLSRTKDFCIKLQKDAAKTGLPVSFDGGMEVFASRQGILVLAWIKIVINPKDVSALTVILENDGYDFSQLMHIVKADKVELPEAISKFRDELCGMKSNVLYMIEAVNRRYGFSDEFARTIIETVESWAASDLLSLGEIAGIIEDSLLDGDFNIELNRTYDSVTCRTIHSSKGLEYPVVIVANVNMRLFPDFKNTSGKITFDDIGGLRMKKMYAEVNGFFGNYDNWRSLFINKICKGENCSESRRLLYVALTRAKQYLYLTSYNPSPFFTGLAELTGHKIITDFSYEGILEYEKGSDEERVAVPLPEPATESVESISVKRYVSRFHESEEYTNSLGNSYAGMEFGKEVHIAAFKHASGIKHKSTSKSEERVIKFIDSLNAGSLQPEADFSIPLNGKLVRGTIDLIAHRDDGIVVVDYKTDKDLSRNDSYKEQVRIYMQAVQALYPERKVTGVIYYSGLDKAVDVA